MRKRGGREQRRRGREEEERTKRGQREERRRDRQDKRQTKKRKNIILIISKSNFIFFSHAETQEFTLGLTQASQMEVTPE